MANTYRNFKGYKNSSSGDIYTNPLIEEALYVNGELKTPDSNGVVTLASNASYTIKGRLYGRIVIGDATETELANDTFIILDGVEIFANDSNAYGIYYASKSQSTYVTLAKNKRNLIVCDYSQEMASNQGAALFSENNMIVQGNGYLTCINKGGHGVRASELRISGNPHIYVEATHDGIHGNSDLTIDGGFFHINGANDAFGTGTTGSIKIFGGTFRCYNIAQNAFDSKVAGYYFSDTLDLLTDATTPISGISKCNPSTYFDTAEVTVDGVAISPTDGVYTISTGTEPSISIKGYIEGTINVGVAKSTVTLSNAYIKGSLNYTLGSSNMQVSSYNDLVNIVEGNIASSNNVKIEAKGGSHLIIKSATNDAISGSEVTIHDSKGVIMVSASASDKYGITGTDIYLADSADHKTFADEAVHGAIIVDSVHARLSGKGKKGNITIKSDNLKGCVCINSVGKANGSSDTTGVNLDKSPNVFYHSIYGDVIKNDCGKTYEPHDFIPYGIGTFPL